MKHLASAFFLTVLVCPAAVADPGDYTLPEILRNLFIPPDADKPVTPEQRDGPYPLVRNPYTFDDGFDPLRYYAWQGVTLHSSTGATCGNGSPYRFFVNRSPTTRNMVIYFEGGGACWDFETCSGRAGILGARNPNGIPPDYLGSGDPRTDLVSPFVFRLNPLPLSQVKTQAWTIVYVPYCTGDVYSGDSVAVYDDPDGAEPPLVWHHNGLRNVRAMVGWLKDNLEHPTQMLATGCSAGGAGSFINYAQLRRDIEPGFGFLINDSGPIFPAALPQSPSRPLHDQIIDAWGLDEVSEFGITPLELIGSELPDFDAADLGSLNAALARKYPADRLGVTLFWQDFNYSRYSYERFWDDIINAPNPQTAELLIRLRWYADTFALIGALAPEPNFGAYVPNFRDLNDSHCSTIVDFRRGDIQEAGLELSDFIDNVLNGNGPVLQAAEFNWFADFLRPRDPLYQFIDDQI